MVPTNPASPLSDLFRCVFDIFSEIDDATSIQVGKGYREWFGVGKEAKILFVPDPKGQFTDPPTGCGGFRFEGGIIHGCAVYVRGVEDGSDIGRNDDGYRLADRVISALQRAARGRIGGGDFNEDSPTDADALGADIAFKFTYHRGIQRSKEVWSLPSNPIAQSPTDINRPPGSPASTVEPNAVVMTPAP
jgi:hypothetical protein